MRENQPLRAGSTMIEAAPSQKPTGLLRLPELALRDLRLLPIAVVVTIITFANGTDPDLWWHLKTGELIVKSHRVLVSDPFSWTAAGRASFIDEWLSEALIYWLQSNIGFEVAVATTAATIIATLAIVYRLSLRICSRELVVVGLVALSALMMLAFTKVRPEVFTWLFFAIFVRQLYLNYQGERVSLWVLPFLMIAWSNMHLGYVFGLMAMYVWLMCLWLRDQPTAFAHLRAPLMLTVLTTLCPAISPVGPRALLIPFSFVASDRLAFNAISELASPDFHAIAFAPLATGIAVLLIVGLPVGRRHLFGLVLSLIVVGMALTAQRNIALFAIVFPVVASQSIANRWPGHMRVPRPGVNSLNWAICIVTLLLTLARLPSVGGQVHSEPHVSSGLPSEGVAYLHEHPLGTRMFNSFDWGGYLIDQLYPGVKVSIDGRSHLYGDAILNQYLTIYDLKPGWREELATLNPDFILMPKDSPLAGELRYDAGWRLAFEGHVEMIFVPSRVPGSGVTRV